MKRGGRKVKVRYSKAAVRTILGERLQKLENKVIRAIKKQVAHSEVYAMTVRMNNLRAELSHL